jgi:3-oxoacyl-[acyl-carrier-protein] synthase-1
MRSRLRRRFELESPGLKPRYWLVNLAVRAIRESLRYRHFPGRLGLILAVPEQERTHPGTVDSEPAQFVASIAAAVGDQTFHLTNVAGEGGAGIAEGLRMARDLFQGGGLDACLVGGVDSLVNSVETGRLREAGRFLEPGNPKGLIPGEGAGILLVVPVNTFPGAVAQISGIGIATEKYPVSGPFLSQGREFEKALSGAIEDAGLPESKVSFRVSTVNGEHYAVWESMFYTSRFYRTRREVFPVWYTASSTGDLGAASGAVSVILAALGIAGGYAPGPCAMCESTSENGLRGACLVGPAAGRPSPPFRPEGGASLLVSRYLEAAP